MALDKVIDSAKHKAELKSIADSIRAKGKTAAQFKSAAEMKQAIDNISTDADTSDATATETEIFDGATAYLADGTKHTGSFTIQSELNEQATRIKAVEEALKGKGCGGGGGEAPRIVDVTIKNNNASQYADFTFVNDQGNLQGISVTPNRQVSIKMNVASMAFVKKFKNFKILPSSTEDYNISSEQDALLPNPNSQGFTVVLTAR